MDNDNSANNNYIENKNQPVKLPLWVAVVLCISLLLIIKMNSSINNMEREISNLQNNINSINHSVNSSISNNISQINEMLKKETSLVSEFKFQMGELKDKRIDVLLDLKPKAYTEGQKLYFSCKIGNKSPELFEARTVDNVNFTAKVNISVFDNMDIDLVIDDGKSKKTEKLESIYRPVEKFTEMLSPRSLSENTSYDREKGVLKVIYQQLELVNNRGDVQDYKIRDVKLEVAVNDKVIDTMPIPEDTASHANRHYIELRDYEIPCKAGDVVKMYMTAKDDNGFNYKGVATAWDIRQDGAMDNSLKKMEMGSMQIS